MTKGIVLVVDDDAAIVEMLTMALDGEGYDVLSAVGGAALQLATDLRPAVILLDLMMPGIDGMEMSRQLRADPRTAAIPIVVMSARERLHSAGDAIPADDRLPKPFALARLYEIVARWAAPVERPALAARLRSA